MDSTKSQRIGVALFGAGMIAPKQVQALSAAKERVQLKAIVSQHPERAAHLAQHYAGEAPEFTSDLASIIHNPEIHVAIIATPPSVRMELIEELAKAGKHILLEKPIARTVSEALRVVEVCESAEVTLGIVFQHRMHASSKAAAQIVASGQLGKIGLVEIAAPLWRDQSYYDELGRGSYARDGGGVLITQAIHTIDLALSLAGPVSRVQAMSATTALHTMESEDYAVAGLHFTSGSVGSLTASTATFPHGRETIALHGQHGSLHVGTKTLDLHWRDGRHEVVVSDESGAKADTGSGYKAHQSVIEDFIDAINLNRKPVVTGREGLRSQQLIEAIETSSRLGVAVSMTD